MSKIIKFLLSGFTAALAAFLGIAIAMAFGMSGTSMIILPVLFGAIAFLVSRFILKLFKLRTLILLVLLWIFIGGASSMGLFG